MMVSYMYQPTDHNSPFLWFNNRPKIDLKEQLYFELVCFGYISFNSELGIIWNNVTNRQMGYVSNSGYIGLGWRYQGRVVHMLAHRLIWMCCHDFIPIGLEINHINSIRSDNRIANLELVTPRQNNLHAIQNNRVDFGSISNKLKAWYSENPGVGAKLTDDHVREIRNRYALGGKANTSRALGLIYGVEHSTILDIVNYKSYKWVK